MQCGHCGATVSADHRFCPSCGRPVVDPRTPPAVNPYAPPPAVNPYAPPPPPNPYAPPPNPYAYRPPGSPSPNPYAMPPYAAPNPYATNGFAIASFVLGLVGWLPCGVGSVLAVVFGLIARHQIQTPGTSGGKGGDRLAIAGIVLGFVGVAGWMILLIAGLISGDDSSSALGH